MTIAVTVERDGADERKGTYRLRTSLSLSGPLTPAQREELLAVAGKCPVHKLMAQATTEVVTELASAWARSPASTSGFRCRSGTASPARRRRRRPRIKDR